MNEGKVAAVVVLYKPNHEIFRRLLESIYEQVDLLILIDNGQDADRILPLLELFPTSQYHELKKNYGLGYALNLGFSLASALGFKYVATFDQDSIASSGMIDALLQSQINLKKAGIKCAALSPIFYDLREKIKSFFPVYREVNGKIIVNTPCTQINNLLEADYLITSGMLIDVQAWNEGIKFNEDFFVDYTDIEWCFRCRSMGYQLYANSEIEMGHTLSDNFRKPILGLNFLQYSPIRRYYFYRNVLYFCKLNFVSLAWKKRLLKSLAIKFFLNPLVDQSPWGSLKMMGRGIFDGILGRLGPR